MLWVNGAQLPPLSLRGLSKLLRNQIDKTAPAGYYDGITDLKRLRQSEHLFSYAGDGQSTRYEGLLQLDVFAVNDTREPLDSERVRIVEQQIDDLILPLSPCSIHSGFQYSAK